MTYRKNTIKVLYVLLLYLCMVNQDSKKTTEKSDIHIYSLIYNSGMLNITIFYHVLLTLIFCRFIAIFFISLREYI